MTDHVDTLDELVLQLGEPDTRPLAMEALLAAGSEGIIALRQGLKDPDPVVRRFAARALDHSVLDRETVTALIELIRVETIPKVRSAAVHILACAGCKPKGCSLENDVVGVLIDVLLNDPSAEVRRQPLDGLGVAEPEERVLKALQVATEDKAKKIRQKAVNYLSIQQARVRKQRSDAANRPSR